jgi:tetratricopeptide (TPR) repeat protein
MDVARYQVHADTVKGLVQGESNTVTQIFYSDREKSDFFVLNLERFKLSNFVHLNQDITNKLINIICHHRILVLGGSDDIDKAEIARYLAWHLGNDFQDRITPENFNFLIKEWQHSSDTPCIDVEIQKINTPTIFILTRLSPQEVGYDLARIQKAASSGGHYVVVSTDTSLNSWKLADSEKVFCQELFIDGLYNQDDLVKELKNKLNEAPENLLNELREKLNEAEESLIIDENLSLGKFTEQLKTPDKIARFVQLLCAENKPLSKETIYKLILLAQDNEKILSRWFNSVLEPRERLIALGLNFFDGLIDEQCLAGIGELVKYEWQRREPSLRALDHCDLHNLHNFFRPVEMQTARAKKIESWLPKQRLKLFEVAWDSYRQRIYTALPVLVKLVKNSVYRGSYEQKVYGIPVGQQLYGFKGNRIRSDKLRRVIGEAISDVGLIDSSAVQDTLLELAADKDIAVQAVAARAMARWHDPDYRHDKELFDTIRSLQGKKLKNTDEKKGKTPQDYVLATIALTVSHAAKYDAPGELSQEIHDWLMKLSDNPSPLIRQRFRALILRMIVPQHLTQLRDVLRNLTQHTDLRQKIVERLESCYPVNPEEVLRTLNLWHDECVQNRSQLLDDETAISSRETLLATVAQVYGAIQYDGAFGQLHRILLEERHHFVRQEVVKAICTQTQQNFERVEQQLQALIPEFKDKEIDQIVKILSEVYLKQRETLEGCDANRESHESRFPVWMNSERQPTAMEEAMLSWLKSDDNVAAQVIGARLVLGKPIEPKKVAKTLDLWFTECVQTRPLLIDKAQISSHEALLATVALLSIEVQCNQQMSKFTVEKALGYLHNILAIEKHPFVRRTVVNGIRWQASRHFQHLEPHIEALIGQFTHDERRQIVEILPEDYLKEHEGLEGSYDESEVNEDLSPIGIDQEPPTANEASNNEAINREPTTQQNAEQPPQSTIYHRDEPISWSIITFILISIVALINFCSSSPTRQAESFFSQAENKVERGDYRGATEGFTQVIRIDPNYTDAYLQRGNAQYYLKEYDAAIEDYTKVINLAPDYADAYYNRGTVLQELGYKKEAIEDYQKAAGIYKKQGMKDAYQNALSSLQELQK